MEDYLRTHVEIDLDAILFNIRLMKHKAGGTPVMAVIKTDGYGHGAVPIAKVLKDEVSYFAVATVPEAVELREAGVTLPILILSYSSPKQARDLIAHDITQTVYSYDLAKGLSDAAVRMGKTAKIHIALDTGMSRIGYQVTRESVDEIARIKALPNLNVEGLFTHFACADETDKTFALHQMAQYDRFCQWLDEAGISFRIRHVCNSAGIIDFDHHRFDLVRSGIVTYGLYPSDEVDHSEPHLHPALTWKSHIIHLKPLEAGRSISYGATYTTAEPRVIATVPVGYGDGYPRSLSNKGYVLVHGQRAPIVGRVCMDQFMIDVTDIPGIEIEDEVVLVGRQGGSEIALDDISDLSGRFNYEFACDINKRVPRVYFRDGEEIDPSAL
ncbi:MAG: alanine racemase [Butyricicoccaceae bacterium]